MYKDAKEELKRLEDALLAEDGLTQTDGYDTEEETQEDYEEVAVRGNGAQKAHAALVTILILSIAAVVIYWFVRYGRDLL